MIGALQGKSIIVTGAGSGIGRAAALLFAQAGALLTLADVNRGAAEATASAITDSGAAAVGVCADVSDEAAVEALVARAVGEYGRLDGAFNNAGISGDIARTADMRLEAFEQVLRVNLVGVFLCVKHEIRAMLATGGGSIVNSSSGLGVVGQEGCAAYAASKAGVLGVTRCAAVEYARQGIRVNAILPGVVRTAMIEAAPPEVNAMVEAAHPIGRIAEPHEIAELAMFLLSDAASFMTASSVPIDGGHTAV